MNIRNVGIVFSPTLNIPAPVISAFLTDFDSIFGPGPEDSGRQSEEPSRHEQPPFLSATSRQESYSSQFPRPGMLLDVPISSPTFRQDIFHNRQSVLIQPQPEMEPPTGLGIQEPTAASLRPAREDSVDKGSIPPKGRSGSNDAASKRLTGLGATSMMRDAKARRRESSMLTVEGDFSLRKPSLPILRTHKNSLGRLPIPLLSKEQTLTDFSVRYAST